MLIGLTIFMTVLVLACPFALDRLEHEDSLGRVAKMLLFTFVALILFLTLGIRSFDGNRVVNFRLFQCYRGLLNQFLYNWKTYKFHYNAEQFKIISTGICNIVVNVVLFMPLGYLLPRAIPKQRYNCRWIFLIGIAFSLAIETLQLLTHRGCFDLDDLLNNSIGSLLGYVLGKHTTTSQKQT